MKTFRNLRKNWQPLQNQNFHQRQQKTLCVRTIVYMLLFQGEEYLNWNKTSILCGKLKRLYTFLIHETFNQILEIKTLLGKDK